MYLDARNLQTTASSESSVRALDESIAAYLGARRDTLQRAFEASDADADCVLAYALRGYLLMHTCKRESAEGANQALLRARAAADRAGATTRERLHVDALEAWVRGQHTEARKLWEAILQDWPRDILALRLAQFITSYLGESCAIRDSVARVFPAWDEQTPGFGFVLGCYAYGLEEAGEYDEAEKLGRRAIDLNPSDLWAAHAVTHVMEMDGRPRHGISWLDEMQRQWNDCNNFVRHLAWHRGLFYLALADYDAALACYDQQVRAEFTDEYLDIANAASLLWRLEQADINVGSRWDELAARCSEHSNDHFFVFADLHYLIPLAAKAPAKADEFLDSCALLADEQSGTQARVMREVGLSVARALVLHRRGAYAEAAELLCAVQRYFQLIGGSHAQRDTFDQLLIDSALRSGDYELARTQLTRRSERRPHDLWSWRTLATGFATTRETQTAQNAATRLQALLERDAAFRSNAVSGNGAAEELSHDHQ
jgi:tetratricopeptide (TPR) repeat protein